MLDVGTGTGFGARRAASLGHRVVGIDLSPKMLDVARSRANANGVAVEFALGDAVAPAFPPGSFDALTNRSLIWTLLELDAALAAWHALLRPGGRLVCFYDLVARSSSASPLRPKQESRGEFFDQHYTPETRELLAGIGLSEHAPLIAAVMAAGFASPDVRTLDVVDPHEEKPIPPHYALTASA